MALNARPRIIALGRRNDRHICSTFSYLKGRASTSIFDFSEEGAQFGVSFNENSFLANFGDVTVGPGDPVIIWPRVKPPKPIHTSSQMVDDATYRIGQWVSSLFSTLPLFGASHIFNAGAYQGARRAKPYQMLMARKVGFSTPGSVVTNTINHLRAIGSESLIYKPINELVHETAGRPLTTGFSHAELTKLSEMVQAHPAIYQERVAGVREWRVHIFGDKIFAFYQPGVPLDSDRADVRRRGAGLLQPSSADCVDSLSARCRAFLQLMEWDIGIFDFIETSDGEFVFLECNHDGQWFWATNQFQTPLPSALADVFALKLAQLSRETAECSSRQPLP